MQFIANATNPEVISEEIIAKMACDAPYRGRSEGGCVFLNHNRKYVRPTQSFLERGFNK